MKKTFSIFFMFILLVSCQPINVNQSKEIPLTSTQKNTESTITPNVVVSETLVTNTPNFTLEPKYADLNKPTTTLLSVFSNPTSLSGKLIIKDDKSHFMINFEKDEIVNLNINPDCEIYQYDANKICLSNGTLIHFQENQSLTTLLSGNFTKKRLNSDFLVLFEHLENYKTNIYTYSLVDKTLQKIYSLDLLKEGWLVLPKLSNNTMKIAGVKNIGPWNNELSIIALQNNEEYKINIEQPDFLTYNVAWSPMDKYVLVGASDVHTEIGYCSNRLIVYETSEFSKIYDVINEEVKCFDDFDMYAFLNPSSIWTQEETKLALVADNQFLCIGDIKNQSIYCIHMESQVFSVAWSPDSKFVAVLVSDISKQIIVLDTQTNEIVLKVPIEKELSGKRFVMDWFE